jgi:hypothetical protein
MSCRQLLVRLSLVATVIGVAPPPGRADVIVLSQIRSIEGTTTVFGLPDLFSHTAPLDAPWIISDEASSAAGTASSFATAEQDSRVGPLAFSATGSARGEAFAGLADRADAQFVSSLYTVEFRLTTPAVFSWSSEVTAFAFGGFSDILGLVRFVRTDIPAQLFEISAEPSGSAASTGSGLLPQGEYSLFAHAATTSVFANDIFPQSGGAANYRFNLNLTPTPIPEPTTLALLGTGLGVMIFRKRIRR